MPHIDYKPPVRLTIDQKRVNEIEQLRKSNGELIDQVSNLEEKVAILTSDDDTAEVKYDSMRRELDAKNHRIQQMTEEIRRLKTRLKYLTK